MSISGGPVAGLVNTCFHMFGLGRPIVIALGSVVALGGGVACAANYLVSHITKDCSDQIVTLSADGTGSYVGKDSFDFTISDAVKPHKVCVTPVTPQQAMAYNDTKQEAWVDFQKWKNGGGA